MALEAVDDYTITAKSGEKPIIRIRFEFDESMADVIRREFVALVSDLLSGALS